MAVLSLAQAENYARNAGFSGQGLTIILAIAQAESGLNTNATNSAGNSAGVDRGILQINSAYHSEVSDSCAFDPACAFGAGYRISSNGTNFNPWSTYTNGAYKRYMGSGGGSSGNGGGVKPWYTFPRIDNLGGVEPFGGFPKPDSNIQLPANYPITALEGGTITGLDTQSAWGGSLTIKLDTPENNLATHEAYLHLAGFAPGVHIGEHVNQGDLIAYNGGANAMGTQKVPLGFAFYAGDDYGFGSAWQLETKANLAGGPLDPVPLLNRAARGVLPDASGTFGKGFDPTQNYAGTNESISQQIHDTLVSVPGFYGIVLAIDEAEQFPGIVNYTTSAIDVSGMIRSVMGTIIDNTMAAAVRGLLIFVGLLLMTGLIWNAVQASGADEKIMQYLPMIAAA